MSGGECLRASRVDQDEIEGAALDGFENVVSLLLGAQLVRKVLLIDTDIIGGKGHQILLGIMVNNRWPRFEHGRDLPRTGWRSMAL